MLTFEALKQIIKIFTHLKLCLANAIHNFKWPKIADICLIWDQTFASWCLNSWCLNSRFVPNNSGLVGK